MKKLPLLPLLLLLAASCKKSSSSSATTISGTWSLIEITVQLTNTVDQAYGGDDYVDATTTDYTTTNNAGTMAFNGGVVTESGITYEANFIAVDSSYMDGQLIGTYSIPYDVTLPAANGSSKYQLIGSDSLYFPGGGMLSLGTSGTTQTQPQGSRFTIHNDTLTMVSNLHQVTTQNVGGIPATQTVNGLEITTLKRQ